MATVYPIAGERADTSGVQFHPADHIARKPTKAELRLHGPIGFVRSLIWFITGRFLELDDQVVDGLLERQKSEHANIALVGALLMTITFSYIPPLLDWPQDWVTGAFGFATSMCNCMVVCSVSLSTGMLLCLNVLKDDTECRNFLNKIGMFELVPFQTLWGAICMFGFVVGTIQYYRMLDFDNWFFYIITITYVPAMMIVPLTVWAYIKGLFGLREDDVKDSLLHVDAVLAEALLTEYLKTFFKGNVNLVPGCGTEYNEFIAWVKTTRRVEYISRTGLVNLRNRFVSVLGEYSYDYK